MALAQHSNTEVVFQHRTGKPKLPTLVGMFEPKMEDQRKAHWFEFAERIDRSPFPDLPHIIYVGHGQQRYGHVKKTVAYVAVDEDEHGQPVMERWLLRRRMNYDNSWMQLD
jgi:hypothetical protein